MIGQWKKIYRDLMCEILSKRYHRQGEYYKEGLCIGAADMIDSRGTAYENKKGVDY